MLYIFIDVIITFQKSVSIHSFFYIYIYLFICLFLAALGLRCCVWAFSSCGERGLLFVEVHGLLIVGLLLLFSSCGARASVVVVHRLQSEGSVVVVHGFSCSVACGIFPDQGLKRCPLHWQADSQPLCHQGSPSIHS